ncbi:translation initiation factor IF-2 [bacterium]|nr:translation initiation factor IF-2 [bacterium]
MATTKLKVYELAKELGIEGQTLVGQIQRLGIDIKNAMSVIGTEEVRTVREHYRKNAKMSAAAAVTTTPGVTEKRVGATVIRRRKGPASEAKEAAAAAATESVVSTEEEAPPTLEIQEEVAELAAPEGEVTEVIEEVVSEVVPTTEEASTAAPTTTVIKRRVYGSIIKKVATEAHLTEQVGPKVEKKERPKTAPTAAAGTTGASATDPLRRVKEVDFAGPDAAAAKDAGKRKLAARQDSVFRSTDYLKRELIHATKKKKNVINRPAMRTMITKPAEHKRVVEMGTHILVSEFSKELGQKASAVIGKLMGMGVTAAINDQIDFDTAALLAPEYGFEAKQKVFREEDYIPQMDTAAGEMKARPPVVTIMGHVDHGKTSLLDKIRSAKVAAGEAGGITQHVGAYTVQTAKGKVTFVDTPGHEAFTAMRARGAKVTDIVVVVVSAVDGVMPQTLESINHAQAASVPIIVAINKIDLPDGNPDRIKQTLAGHGLNPEEWGGETMYLGVSAKTGQGIDELLEGILLQSEMLELQANYDTPARGTVIESRLEKARGPVATVLVQQGKLSAGDLVVCGATFGKVRAMQDCNGKRATEALPGDPVEILGLPEVPVTGDDFFVAQDEKSARELTAVRADRLKQAAQGNRPKMTLEQMLAGDTGTTKELRLILKADVQGSVEALREALSKIPADKVRLRILHYATGGITEGDVMLASASKAAVVGFSVRPDSKSLKIAETEGVEVRTYNIIYELLDEVRALMEGLLDKQVKEKVIGRAEVRELFTVPKIGVIAGSSVIDGKVTRGSFLRLLRDGRVIYTGKISSLRRFKDDVKEVIQGFECGIGLENFNDLKPGDQFEAFVKEEHSDTL